MFKVFPEFTKLTLSDRKEYQDRIASYPPVGDIQFSALMTWWDSLAGVFVSELNGNLVIQYWRSGDELNSGLSLVGKNDIDESICMLLDYLRQIGEPLRLTNVPEFVISETQQSDLFCFKENRANDEYIVPMARFYPLKDVNSFRRRRIERQFKNFGSDRITLRSLNLQLDDDKQLLLRITAKWWHKNLNNFGTVGYDAMRFTINEAEALDTKNVCIFADNEIIGFCLYQEPTDSRYLILTHVKASHPDTTGFELIGYLLGKWFAERGCQYGNLTQDWGRLRLRMFLMTLGPVNYFRKYTIEPATQPNLALRK